MRIYYDKKNNEITIVGKQGELPSVTFIQDRGRGRHTNFFGDPLGRYRYHYSSIDEGYSTSTNNLNVDSKDRVYLIKKQTRKIKVKI